MDDYVDVLRSQANNTMEEPIAIICATYRLAGEADSMNGFWNMMSGSRTGHGEVPKERWDAEAWYHPDLDLKDAVSWNFCISIWSTDFDIH